MNNSHNIYMSVDLTHSMVNYELMLFYIIFNEYGEIWKFA